MKSADKKAGGTRRRLVLYGNPALRRQAEPIKDITADIGKLCADLKATMLAEEGLGLAANQVALPLQVFAINPRAVDVDAEPYCVINPRIVATEGAIEREEGCLSVPEVYDVVSRPELVRIAGLDENGKPVEIEATGLLGRAFVHEVNHLNGILFIDFLGETRRRLLAKRLKEIEAREAASCG